MKNKEILYNFIEWLKDTRDLELFEILVLDNVTSYDIKSYTVACLQDEAESYSSEDILKIKEILEKIFILDETEGEI